MPDSKISEIVHYISMKSIELGGGYRAVIKKNNSNPDEIKQEHVLYYNDIEVSHLIFSTKEIDHMNSESLIGLSKRSAQNATEAANFIFRLIKVDDEEFMPYPDDQRLDRVCVEIAKGKVVKAVIQ